jgi:hypothetical protein
MNKPIQKKESTTGEPQVKVKRKIKCDRCGADMVGRSCKIICPNCGNRFDCSDLNVYFDEWE